MTLLTRRSTSRPMVWHILSRDLRKCSLTLYRFNLLISSVDFPENIGPNINWICPPFTMVGSILGGLLIFWNESSKICLQAQTDVYILSFYSWKFWPYTKIYGRKFRPYILVYGRNFQNIVKLYWKGLHPLNIYSQKKIEFIVHKFSQILCHQPSGFGSWIILDLSCT